MLFLLYIYHDHLILLLRLCVDMDDIHVIFIIVCCMAASHPLDCILHVYVEHTYIPFISKSLVSANLSLLIVCLIRDLLLLICSSIELVTRSKV